MVKPVIEGFIDEKPEMLQILCLLRGQGEELIQAIICLKTKGGYCCCFSFCNAVFKFSQTRLALNPVMCSSVGIKTQTF